MPWHLSKKGYNCCKFCGRENDRKTFRVLGNGEPDADLVLTCPDDLEKARQFINQFPPKARA
jgi:hypothetical protein